MDEVNWAFMYDSLTSESCLYKLWVLAIDVEAISGTLETERGQGIHTMPKCHLSDLCLQREKVANLRK